jgi:radical SAM protein with 4Fe4S-binding SPASM domain
MPAPAVIFDDDSVIGLSSFVRMRPEQAKVVFAYLPHMTLQYCIITPTEAILLCLFDGKRPLRDIYALTSLFSGIDYDSGKRLITDVMHRVSSDLDAFVRADAGRVARFDPASFAVLDTHITSKMRLEAPLTMILQPTWQCETDCVYCYASRRKIPPERLLTLGRIAEILDEAAEIGIYQVNLCGGDGFCRPDFLEIIRACLSRNLIVDISTKAHIGKLVARDLADMGLDYIQVSFDTADEQTADLLFGRKGHFHRVIETILNLIEAGIYTRTNSIITPANIDHIERTITFLKELGVREMKFTPAFRSLYRNNRKWMIGVEEKRRFKAEMERLQMTNASDGVRIFYDAMDDFTELDIEGKRKYWFSGRPRCSSGRSNLVVAADGRVYPCEESPQTEEFVLGDLTKQCIREVWNSREMAQFIYPGRTQFKSTACFDCDNFEACVHDIGHCFRDCVKAYGRKYETNPFCPHAKPSTKRIY